MKKGSIYKISVAVLIFLGCLSSTAQAVCRAAAFSGGGAKGAYEAGVVYGFNHNDKMTPADFAWDVVTGVSAGALNSAGISLWEPSQGKEMSEWLQTTWLSLTDASVYVNWPGGFVQGVTTESGVFDNTPLLNLITGFFTQFKTLKRKTVVSSVDVNTGQYVTFDETHPYSDLPLLTVASASIPFIFPHRHYGDHILMDGGTVWNTNLVSAVDKCKAMGHEDSDIILDIVMCGHPTIDEKTSTGNAISNYLRYYNIDSYYSGINDVLEFKKARPNVQYRYLVMPSQPISGGLDMLNFNPSNTKPMIELGKTDAANAINLGAGHAFKAMEEYAALAEHTKQQVTLNEFIRLAQ